MTTISNTPRPGFVYDSTDDVWYPIGTGTHNHSEIAKTLVDAKGDLIVGTAADTVSRLAVGATDGMVLTVDSAEATGLKYATPAAGSLTLISTTAMTSGSVITLSAIPGTFNSLYLTITGFQAAADALIRLTFNGAASANDYVVVPTDESSLNFNGSFISITAEQDSAGTNSFTWAYFPNYADTTSWKIGQVTSINNDATTNTSVRGVINRVFAKDVTAAITSLVFTLNTSTYAAGTIKLFGVN